MNVIHPWHKHIDGRLTLVREWIGIGRMISSEWQGRTPSNPDIDKSMFVNVALDVFG